MPDTKPTALLDLSIFDNFQTAPAPSLPMRSAAAPLPVPADDRLLQIWSLLHSGYRPVEMVMGSCVYHVAHRGMLSGLGTIGRNVELANFTSAMYEAREIAIERMQYGAANARAEGVVRVEIDPHDRVFRHRHRGVAAGAGDRAGKNRKPDHGVVGERLAHFALGRTPGFRKKFCLAKSFGRDQVPLRGHGRQRVEQPEEGSRRC